MLLILTILFWGNFKIIEATSQDWAGGRKESGYGTYYRFKMIAAKSSEKLLIDRLWIGEDYYEVKPYTEPGRFNSNKFNRADTIFILATRFLGSELTKDRNIQKKSDKYIKPAFNYDGDAIIGYKIRNKRKFKKIKSFTRLKKINYQ